MTGKDLYEAYQTKMQKIADVKYAGAVLQWDQETYLPAKGADHRGRQLATLSEIAHEMFNEEALGNLLEELQSKDDLSPEQKRNVELSAYDYRRNKKIPAAFVRKMSDAVNKSFHAWIQSRKDNTFSAFEQPLHELIELKKQEADMLGYDKHPYDALMNDYDRGLNVAATDELFSSLAPQLTVLLDKISNSEQVDDSFLHKFYDKDTQWKAGLEILKRMQFDFEAGRQDISEHPFTTNFSNQDVRITTRINEHDFSGMMWSCLHEGGHALYEQGLPSSEYGLPLGEYCSLSVHESQSRLWENCIGRSLPFWEHNFSLLQSFFPEQLGNVSEQQFYKAINKVQPSLIRTEADELTYHFHVMIRYELEKKLIEGSLEAKHIPEYWNGAYKKLLGLTVPDDRSGCLQDVHWSHGSFGYFATYSLGSLYAAQLYAAINKENESIEQEIAKGNHQFVLQWLNWNIHQYGRMYDSSALCKKASGKEPDSSYFINYATKKYNAIYNQ